MSRNGYWYWVTDVSGHTIGCIFKGKQLEERKTDLNEASVTADGCICSRYMSKPLHFHLGMETYTFSFKIFLFYGIENYE